MGYGTSRRGFQWRRWLAVCLIAATGIVPVSNLARAEGESPATARAEALIRFLEQEMAAYRHELAAPRFADLAADHWAYPQVERLNHLGVIAGRAEGGFDPEGSVTRAEFLKLLVAALQAVEAPVFKGAPAGHELPPNFVAPDHWVVAQGWFEGGRASGLVQPADYPEGFLPDRPITRGEIARMIVRARAVAADLVVPSADQASPALAKRFTDTASLDPALSRYLAGALELRYLRGFPDGTARPGHRATRAQAAVMVERLLQDLQSIPGWLPGLDGAFDLWNPDPPQIDLAPALGLVDEALALQQVVEADWIDAALDLQATTNALHRTDAAAERQAVAAAQAEVDRWQGLIGYPPGGWALWLADLWAEGSDVEFPAHAEAPELFAAWAEEQAGAAQATLETENLVLDEIRAQATEASGLTRQAEFTLIDAAGAAEAGRTRTRDALGSAMELAQAELARGDCPPIQALYDELARRLAELEQQRAEAEARLREAEAAFQSANQAAMDRQAVVDDLQQKADQALKELQAASAELQQQFSDNIDIPGVSFTPPANPDNWNYAGTSAHGVTTHEAWFQDEQAITDYLDAANHLNQSPAVQAIRARIKAAKEAYRTATEALPAARQAAEAARAKANRRQAERDAAQAAVDALDGRMAAVKAQMDALAAAYKECIKRQADAERIRRASEDAAEAQERAADALDQSIDEARQARRGVRDALSSVAPCPEAEELLDQADEEARRASDLREQIETLRHELTHTLQQGQAGVKAGRTTPEQALSAAAPLADQIADRQRQAEEAARRAKRLAEQAQQALERCQKQREEERQKEGDGGPNPRDITDDQARDLAEKLDDLREEDDPRDKAEKALKILERLADYYASGKRLPDWLRTRVGLGSVAAGGVIDLGIGLINAGPCPWLAIMVARVRALAIEHFDTPRGRYYLMLWQRYASYYTANCERAGR